MGGNRYTPLREATDEAQKCHEYDKRAAAGERGLGFFVYRPNSVEPVLWHFGCLVMAD